MVYILPQLRIFSITSELFLALMGEETELFSME